MIDNQTLDVAKIADYFKALPTSNDDNVKKTLFDSAVTCSKIVPGKTRRCELIDDSANETIINFILKVVKYYQATFSQTLKIMIKR